MDTSKPAHRRPADCKLGHRRGVLAPVRILSRCVLAPRFKLDVQGADNLPPHGSFLLLPKHQRWEDIPLLGLATPRPLYYIAKAELFASPAAEWFIKSLGGIPLNRQRPIESRRYLQRTAEILTGGRGAVVVFPEGTYFVGKVGPGRTGVLKFILSRLPLPCIPVGIRYRNAGLRTQVRVRYGTAHRPPESGLTEGFMEKIMERIAALSALPRI